MTAALILFGVSAAVAQSAVTGKIVDETGAPLIGASVTVPGTSQGVSTDVDGNFTLKTDAKEIEISYVGYVPTKKPVTGPNARLGIIQMEPDAVALQDVIVMQSVAVQRKTPVAVSTVNAEEISYKLGGQEFPEILKSTPGVYVTKDGGGFGDSKINMRGFQAANVAVMVNGVPVNDMEWGGGILVELGRPRGRDAQHADPARPGRLENLVALGRRFGQHRDQRHRGQAGRHVLVRRR